jgi:hypothetical protein
MSNIDPDAWRTASNALRSVDRATGRPPFIAARIFSLTRIGIDMPDAPIRGGSATSFQRGQMKNALSFFFAICLFECDDRRHAGAAVEAASGVCDRLVTC